MRFLHAADIHLGYRQYNSAERFEDFGATFQKIVDCAIEENVQACLIAGDLFHKASIEPATLIQAEKALDRLKERGIRTLAISGNHDRARYGQAKTWLDYLDERGLLQLLESFENGRFLVAGQSYVDVEGVRFIGVPYGGPTRAVLQAIHKELLGLPRDGIRFCVLMVHAGIEGQMLDVPDVLRFEDVNPLREHVDYLALGHLHKPFEAPADAPWIYNPGAIENNDFEEAFFRGEKGVYIVSIEEDSTPRVEKREIKGRPFRQVEFPITRYEDFDSLVEAMREELQALRNTWRDAQRPVVRLILTGNVKFDRSRLDVEGLRQLAEDTLDCLLVRISTALDNVAMIGDYDDELTAEQLERQVFTDIAREHGYGAQSEQWGRFLREMKRKALAKEPPEDIYETLSAHLADVSKESE